MNAPLERLRYHVTGAIERGEAEPIIAIEAQEAIERREIVHSQVQRLRNANDDRGEP